MVEPPTKAQLREFAADYDASLSSDDLDAYQVIADSWTTDVDRLEELADEYSIASDTGRSPVRSAVDARRASDSANAFVRRFRIEGDEGPLDGYEIGIKDNVAIAGVEMTCGSSAFTGYVPSDDAVVVERVLEAGASITGTLNLDAMAFSGSGELSDHGPVPNPHDEDHLAGGSSSGCAVAVVENLVDAAIGTDQAGSVRVPAAWSGCVGLKPTFGLVPYTGGVNLEPTVDHVGPLANTVGDCALVLDAISGSHPSDSRQTNPPNVTATAALSRDEPLTIGVLEEGFGHDESESALEKCVRSTVSALDRRGHEIETVSVPLHKDGGAIYNGVVLEAIAALVRDESVGYYRRGSYDVDFADHFAAVRRSRMDEFPHAMILTVAFGRYLAAEYRGRYHALAQELRRALSDRYDAVLADVDVLAMPTTPQTAHERRPDAPLVERLERSANMFQNTAPFNLTGHPAVSVPCGSVGGLPVGLMLVGSRFGDATVLRGARAVEALHTE